MLTKDGGKNFLSDDQCTFKGFVTSQAEIARVPAIIHLFSDVEARWTALQVPLAAWLATPHNDTLRRAVAQGTVIGPQLWVASPQLTGRPSENALVVTSAEEARVAVKTAADAGYDFLKITMFITKPVYDAIIDEARQRSIRVVGHVERTGVDRGRPLRPRLLRRLCQPILAARADGDAPAPGCHLERDGRAEA